MHSTARNKHASTADMAAHVTLHDCTKISKLKARTCICNAQRGMVCGAEAAYGKHPKQMPHPHTLFLVTDGEANM